MSRLVWKLIMIADVDEGSLTSDRLVCTHSGQCLCVLQMTDFSCATFIPVGTYKDHL